MENSIKLIAVLAVALIVGGIAFEISSYGHVNTIEAKVEGKERITQSVGNTIESFYLVYTDKGTFKLEDDMFRGNFYSSDVYGKLKQDSTYKFKTAGYRIGWMSSYPNIIEVK
jgi:hypothetical protein